MASVGQLMNRGYQLSGFRLAKRVRRKCNRSATVHDAKPRRPSSRKDHIINVVSQPDPSSLGSFLNDCLGTCLPNAVVKQPLVTPLLNIQ
ncbi:MAG: hypothetical protein KatS3mg105_0175 [Gemmatales bacterium]|nr:MAG: hypothetical protein KatS3mg105_0175 [Gemmatales bacterium]